MTVNLTLPVPPSTNALWRNVPGKGRVKSTGYRVWLEVAGLLANAQRPGRIAGPYALSIRLPAGIRGDIDNRAKAASDLLVSLGITDDDRHMHALHIERDPSCPADKMRVTVEACNVR